MMNTNVDALKNLYEQLGGDPADVANCSTSVEALNAISAKYGGAADAIINPDAINNIAAVASSIGGGGEPVRYTITFVAYREANAKELSEVTIWVGAEQYTVPLPAPGDTFEFEAHPGQEIVVGLHYTDDISDIRLGAYLPFYTNEGGDAYDSLYGFLPEASYAEYLRCPIRVSN